jgi:hypothetical protein
MHHTTSLLLFGGFVVGGALAACSDGGTRQGETVHVVSAGTGGNTAAGGIPSTVGGAAGSISAGMGGSSGSSMVPTAGSSGSGGGDVGGSASTGGGGTGGGGGAGGGEPAGKIVIFDGKNLDEWISTRNGGPAPWTLANDGSMEVVPGTGDIITKQQWEDVFVHVEYKTPMLPASVGGQDRGNSGVYLKGAYELQVLDTYGQPPQNDGCGSVYEVSAPLVVACFKEEIWNVYDIEFKAPDYDANGTKLSNAVVVSAKLNDILVQTNVDVPGTTRAGLPEAAGPKGLMLQDHGNRLWFRNIWVIPR